MKRMMIVVTAVVLSIFTVATSSASEALDWEWIDPATMELGDSYTKLQERVSSIEIWLHPISENVVTIEIGAQNGFFGNKDLLPATRTGPKEQVSAMIADALEELLTQAQINDPA